MTKLFELLILGLAAVGAGRVLLKPPVLREVRSRPLASLAAVAILLAGLAGLGTGWPGWRALLSITAWAAGGIGLLLLARSRPGYGRARGLPPGSLGIAASLAAIAEPDFYARAAKRSGPVFKMAQFHRPTVCVIDLPLGLQVMETERASLAQPRLPFGRLSPGNYIEFMNDEAHARYRGILRTALSGPVVVACQPGVRSVIHHELTAMADRPDADGIDPDPYLDRIAFASLVRVMFGIAVTDPRLGELERHFAALGTPRAFAERRPEGRLEPYGRLVAIARGLGADILAGRGGSGPESPSVLGEILRADPAHLEDDILIGNLVLMVHVTKSNVRGLLGWTLKEYCDHRSCGQAMRVAATPGGSPRVTIEALATNFVNETLRMHQSEYFYREVVREIRIGDYRIPKGWLVRVCVRECHDRAEVFPHPERFDPDRFAGRQYSRTEYFPFSDGTHSCFGAGLAVMIARTLVTTLATEFEVRKLADGAPIRDGNRHWSHWRPSRTLRLALAPQERIDARLV